MNKNKYTATFPKYFKFEVDRWLKNVGHFTKVDPSVSHQESPSPATAIYLAENAFCAKQAEMFIKQR